MSGINIYISHAPADRLQLGWLLEWLIPMQEKYGLRIWYNYPEPDPIIPFPWSLLFFWYSPPRSGSPYHPDMISRVENADIYLFLTSQKSITTPWIEQEEVPRAIERYMREGNKYVRVFSIALSPSQWRMTSRLSGFPTLGVPGKAVNQVQPPEEARIAIVEQLRPVIEELERNLKEKSALIGMDTGESFLPAMPRGEAPREVNPLPDWLGWIILFFLAWSLFNWFDANCSRPYKPYWPKKEPKEEEYRRENPLSPPED